MVCEVQSNRQQGKSASFVFIWLPAEERETGSAELGWVQGPAPTTRNHPTPTTSTTANQQCEYHPNGFQIHTNG